MHDSYILMEVTCNTLEPGNKGDKSHWRESNCQHPEDQKASPVQIQGQWPCEPVIPLQESRMDVSTAALLEPIVVFDRSHCSLGY